MEIKVKSKKMFVGSSCFLCEASIEDKESHYVLTKAERDKGLFDEPRYSEVEICKKCFKDGIKFTTRSHGSGK